ncbi:hypothetical protein GOP47_0016723 [Adiantum capillus-veneris]|uniref:TF-B3 domain-containing protein n=1 Tax=Adiantum capillus-veneris TaxID=13818 RepID=A0A9D4ZAK7_ADICA|nr:hypothetical protein GOP47_0016723 [Adiantum capillus-veneris]
MGGAAAEAAAKTAPCSCVSPASCSQEMMTIVHTEYIACRHCASQCYTSHSDRDLVADDFACDDKEKELGQVGNGPPMPLLLRNIKNFLLTKRRRPQVAPSFVRIVSCDMLPPDRQSYMSFPRSFVDLHLSKCVGEATLEGPSGWLWHSTLQMHRDSMVLPSPGWAAFAKDHCLQEGDGLIFTYVGRNYFKVRIFGLKEGYVEKGNDCMPGFAAIVPHAAKACIENEHDIFKAERDQVPASNQQIFSTNCLCSGNGREEHLLGVDANGKLPNLACYNNEMNQHVDDYIVSREVIQGRLENDKHEEQEECSKITGSKIQSWFSSGICTNFLCSDNNQVTKLLPISAVHGDFKLVFPMPFVQLHMPSRNEWITLVDSSQTSWQCRWLGDAHTRERLYICGGWGPFVRAYSLKVNDVCVFELVDKETLTFNVYVFKF